MKKIILLFCGLSFLLSACSDDLSKGKAENMIENRMIKDSIKKEKDYFPDYPLYVKFDEQGTWYTQLIGGGVLSFDKLKKLENEGYLLIYKVKGREDESLRFVQSFTEKSKPFLTLIKEEYMGYEHAAYYLQLATIDKIVVTSISKPRAIDEGLGFGIGAKEYKVEYEIKFKPNVLGEKIQLSPDELIVKRGATFIYADKEWRIGQLYYRN